MVSRHQMLLQMRLSVVFLRLFLNLKSIGNLNGFQVAFLWRFEMYYGRIAPPLCMTTSFVSLFLSIVAYRYNETRMIVGLFLIAFVISSFNIILAVKDDFEYDTKSFPFLVVGLIFFAIGFLLFLYLLFTNQLTV